MGGEGRGEISGRCETLMISEEETWTALIVATKRVDSPAVWIQESDAPDAINGLAGVSRGTLPAASPRLE